ncbi:Ig-like domain-containing protein [Lachnoclostridium sp.]|uniref:Ig-like domain-containing protein n=1 Tax=Lachnoclostridium sp. TaxID=2028282 RepID=UPI002898EBA8|nr:Ig-like domain-containing protein [Lachnoclostridium sp.]
MKSTIIKKWHRLFQSSLYQNRKKLLLFPLILILSCMIVSNLPFHSFQSENVFAKTTEEITLSNTSVNVIVGDKTKLTINGTKEKVIWSVKDKKIATVSTSGYVKGIKKGTTTVSAKVSGKTFTCKVTVEQPVLSCNSYLGVIDNETTLTVSGTTKKVAWTSSNEKVATVTKSGKVKFLAKGNVVITATAGNQSYDCYCTIYTSGDFRKLTKTEKEVMNKIQLILAENITNRMTAVEKIRFVHDYLVLHTEYKELSYRSYHPEGVLIDGMAVCQGYAETFELFMNSLAIENRFVIGTGGGVSHAWNMVKLEDGWYHVDSTWDDPVPDKEGRVLYTYFLLNDEEMKSLRHKWKEKDYPSCNAKKFLTMKDLYTQEVKELEDEKLIKEYQKNGNLLKTWKDYSKEYVKRYQQGEDWVSLMYPQKDAGSVSEMALGVAKLLNYYGTFRYEYEALREVGDYYILKMRISFID